VPSFEGLDDSFAGRVWALATCSQLPTVELAHPFGLTTSVFKVVGRMFAVVSLDDAPGRATLKCDPDYGSFLVQQFDEVTPGYHMNKRHWITLVLSPTLPTDLIEGLITDSYDLVVAALPVGLRSALEAPGR